jgi:hypothetical protein
MIRKSPHNPSNLARAYNITIGTYTLKKEYEFGMLDFLYDLKSPVITGRLIINDIFDIARYVDFKTDIVNVSYIDIFDGSVSMDFIVRRVEEKEHERNQRGIVLTLQDVFSYKLSKSFFSKSFFSNPTKAISTYIDELGLNKYKTNIEKSDLAYEMVIPSHVDNLTSFLREFDKIGYCFYQTKSEIVIKKSDSLTPRNLLVNGQYFDKNEDQYHTNLIHDIKIERNSRRFLKPKTKAIAFDINTKQMSSVEHNTISELAMNNVVENIQDDLDLKTIYQTHTNFDEHKKRMRGSFIQTNTVMVTINGYAKNDLNQIYALKLSGIKTAEETIIDGNGVVSGNYISTAIAEKIMYDHITQTITLVRADERKATQ